MRDYATLNAHQKPSVGDTKLSAVNTDHLGWLLCDGRLVNVSDFYFLFDVIGYSFGGSGSQFRLPEAAGRVPGAIGAGTALTFRGLGDSIGEETHTLTVSELASHTHTGTTSSNGSHSHVTNATGGQGNLGLCIADGTNTATTSDSSLGELNIFTTPRALNVNSNGLHNHTFTTDVEGSNVAHNNIQPTLFVGNMFIYSGKPRYGAFPYEYGANVW